jgi:hypothetical protein
MFIFKFLLKREIEIKREIERSEGDDPNPLNN